MRKISHDRFIVIYHIIGFFGLFFSLKALTFRCFSPGSINLLPGQLPELYFPLTRQTNIFFMLLVPIICAYGLHAMFFLHHRRTQEKTDHNSIWRLIFAIVANSFIAISASSFKLDPVILFSTWLLFFLGVFHLRMRILDDASLQRQLIGMLHFSPSWKASYAPRMLILFSFGLLIWLLYPFVFMPPALPNDFLDIPELTILPGSSGPSRLVDNQLAFQNEKSFGDTFQYNSRFPLASPAIVSNTLGMSDDDKCLFYKMNRLEMNWKILTRGFIHHHNHLLGPANDLMLGRPKKEISSQYGWGWAQALVVALRAMPNGFCYGNYIRLHFSGYLFYYTLLLALLAYLFRNLRWVSIVFAILVILLGSMNQYLWLGPGASPVRHFFDIPLIVCLMSYLKTLKVRYLLASILCCLAAICLSMEFGLILSLAFLGILAFRLLYLHQDRRDSSIRHTICGLVVGSIGIFFVAQACIHMGARNDAARYFFEGCLGVPIGAPILFIIGLGSCASYLAWMLFPASVPIANRTMSLFLLWYAQLLLLYYVRCATFYLFLIIAPFVCLAIAYLLAQFFDNLPTGIRARYSRIVFSLLLVLVLCCSVRVVDVYQNSFRKLFVRNLTEHAVFKWEMPRAHFTSTMDPKYFERSVALICKYSGQKTGIYMISKFDRFIPFIAGHYSAMPFIDLEWFLATQKEVDDTVAFLKRERPAYLFVDTDINKDFVNTQVINASSLYGNYAPESFWRACRLRSMATVFCAVSNEYTRVETADLLTVYRHIDLPSCASSTDPSSGVSLGSSVTKQ